jgi:multiple sugar transport system substrate-binding protein
VNLFIYRTDLYQQLGLKVPRTFEEAYQNGQAAQKSGKAKYGYVARAQATTGGQSITYDFMPLLYAYGGGWFNASWAPMINNSGSVAAMTMFKKLLSLGPAQPQTVGQADVIAAMQSGNTLQIHTVAAAASSILDPSKSNVADKVAFSVMPAGSTGRPAPTAGVWSMTIPQGIGAARARTAYDFITWVLSEPAQLAFAKAGGIPTRRDTYRASDLPPASKPYMAAIEASLPYIQPSIRYPFAMDMLPVAERTLTAIASGTTPVKAGLDELAASMRTIAKDAGYGK